MERENEFECGGCGIMYAFTALKDEAYFTLRRSGKVQMVMTCRDCGEVNTFLFSRDQ